MFLCVLTISDSGDHRTVTLNRGRATDGCANKDTIHLKCCLVLVVETVIIAQMRAILFVRPQIILFGVFIVNVPVMFGGGAKIRRKMNSPFHTRLTTIHGTALTHTCTHTYSYMTHARYIHTHSHRHNETHATLDETQSKSCNRKQQHQKQPQKFPLPANCWQRIALN